MNNITETIYYNDRMLIDSDLFNSDSEPRAWLVSKINRITPKGICNITFAQDRFDQHHDYIERDEDGNVIAMWADYFQTPVAPENIPEQTELIASITAKITASGKTSSIKVSGSKTFTVTYYDEDDQPMEYISGDWSFFINNEDASDLLSISYPSDNKVKVKFIGSEDYIGSILTVKFTSEDGNVTASLNVGIIAF